jgi:hypothetical protein
MGCNDVAVVHSAFNKSPQLGYRLRVDSATQDEHGESPSRRSLSPKSHRSRHLTDIAVPAVLHCIPHRIPQSGYRSQVRQPSAQLDLIENTASKKKLE